MGTFAFKLPDIGEGVVEGEVVEMDGCSWRHCERRRPYFVCHD